MNTEGTLKKIFKANLIIMRLLGFYPPRKPSKFYQMYARCVYIFMTVPVPILAGVHLIVGKNINATEVRASSFIIFQMGSFMFKLSPFIFNPEAVRKSLYMLELRIFRKGEENQKELMDKCERKCKKNTWLFWGICVVTLISWSVTPLFGRGPKLPIEIWLPFEFKSFGVYVAKYIFIVTGVGNGAVATGMIDPLVSGLLYFAVTQLRFLKNNLQNLSENADKETKGSLSDIEHKYVKDEIIYRNIRDSIEHHNAILGFIQVFENVYTPVVFTQLMVAGLVICVSFWQLSTVEPFSISFFSMISFVLTMVSQIILYCYFGSVLFEESNNLTTAIYMGQWYEYNLKCRKTLIILMERSKKPIVVTAGKLLDVTLVTFTTILRRAYSLLAVLKNYSS